MSGNKAVICPKTPAGLAKLAAAAELSPTSYLGPRAIPNPIRGGRLTSGLTLNDCQWCNDRWWEGMKVGADVGPGGWCIWSEWGRVGASGVAGGEDLASNLARSESDHGYRLSSSNGLVSSAMRQLLVKPTYRSRQELGAPPRPRQSQHSFSSSSSHHPPRISYHHPQPPRSISFVDKISSGPNRHPPQSALSDQSL
ncbi:hypothetical protein Tco_0170066 [Tanacetum coccineum]